MVMRKPVAPRLSTSPNAPANNTANPPYPVSPTHDYNKLTASTNSVYSPDLSNSPGLDLIDIKDAQQRARSDSDASSHGTWNTDSEGEEVDVPKPLKVRASPPMDTSGKGKGKEKVDRLPSILRPGRGKVEPRQSQETQRYDDEDQANPWAEPAQQISPQPSGQQVSNNPYLKQASVGEDSSTSEWQEVVMPPAPPTNAPPPPPVELPTMQTPSEELSRMSLGDRRPASWETAEILAVPQQGQSPLPSVTEHMDQPFSQDQNRPVSTWWQEPSHPPPEIQQQASISPPMSPHEIPAKHVEPQYAPPPGPPPPAPQSEEPLIQHEQPAPRPPKPAPAPIQTTQPSRSTDVVPETPGTQLKRQRNEHYQIKHINWTDAATNKLRQSPILTQNANGPCPLLALVNALVLSTPSHLDTALIETLRTREQVSLGLLLDAVFDELMSGRRGDPASALPDVSELYSFLLALHTGMNVNPRFVTPIETPRGSLDGRPPDFDSIHPMHRAQSKPGAFEETREMRMYSTFSVPLIHGWTAPVDTPAYEAFVRSAQSFEDAQNIQFAEAELEDKSRSEGLTPQEQQTLQDIHVIKAFLNTWPTQLTDFGLETISRTLRSGQIAILFRNDHFSTMYKEPTHGALMTLVTDTGYSGHAEIIWESLVDVSGAASEMFSGDFRVVSHDHDARLNQGSSAGGQEGWQTVPGQSQSRYRNSPSRSSESAPPLPGPRPPQPAASTSEPQTEASDLGVQNDEQRTAAEQEDHDLALALQLQEEEEDQQRQSEQRRRREQELSEQFLSNEGEGPRPPIPPRRTGGRTGNAPTTTPSGRAPVTRPADSNNNDPDAPPTYEQAASDQPYRPAGSTASGNMAQGNPLGAYDALRRQQSAYASTSSTNVNDSSPPYARDPRRQSNANRIQRRSSALGGPSVPGAYGASVGQGPQQPGRVSQAAGVKDAEEKCVVM